MMTHNFTRFLMVGLFLCGMGFKGHAETLVEAIDNVTQIYTTTLCQHEDEQAEHQREWQVVQGMDDEEVVTLFEVKMERKREPKDGGISDIRQKFMQNYEFSKARRDEYEASGKEDSYAILGRLKSSLEAGALEGSGPLINKFFDMQARTFFQKMTYRANPLKLGHALFPSTVPESLTMPDVEANRKVIWKTKTRWFNEMDMMKGFISFIADDVRETVLGPLKKDKDYGNFFIILEAYLLDLVEAPPFPDHWEYRIYQNIDEDLRGQVSQLRKNAQALREARTKSTMVMIEDGSMMRMTSASIKYQLSTKEKMLERNQRSMKKFAFLGEQEDEAVEALAQHASGALQQGQWRAEREAEERLAAKKKKVAAKKKEAAKRKKAAAWLEKERLEAEEAARIKAEQMAAAQAEAERLEKEGLEAEARAAQEEVARLEALMESERKAVAERERTIFEEDAVAIAEAMKEHRTQVEEDRRAKARAKAPAAEAEDFEEAEAGPAFPVIRLKDKSHDLMQTFWTAQTMRWIDFRNLFASDEMGFSLIPSGGSIRKFMRDAAEGMPKILFVVHEPHESYQSDSFGPSTLGHLRELFNRQAGWTLESFVRNSK
jgi:hypothetical protein